MDRCDEDFRSKLASRLTQTLTLITEMRIRYPSRRPLFEQLGPPCTHAPMRRVCACLLFQPQPLPLRRVSQAGTHRCNP